MSKYDVDFKKFALSLLPQRLRRPILAAYSYCLVTPISGLHTRFMRHRKDVRYRLYHNGQVCYLRAVINDSFDPINRRITIADAAELKSMIIYARSLMRAKLVPRRDKGEALILNRRGFDGISGYDFVVQVPTDLSLTADDEKRMRSIINTYKIASKRYLIIQQHG